MWLERWVVMKHIDMFHLGNKFNLLRGKRNFTIEEVSGRYYEGKSRERIFRSNIILLITGLHIWNKI